MLNVFSNEHSTVTLHPWTLLGGSGGLSKWVHNGVTRVTLWVIGVSNLLTKSP